MKAELLEILLVEDSPADVRLTIEALRDAKVANHLNVVNNGEDALAFLRQQGVYPEAPRPQLVVLDLNLPRMDGKEVLAEIKDDPDLRRIPVAVLTTSSTEADVVRSYELGANCYLTKPVGLDQFITVVTSIESFWLGLVRLPPR